MNLDHKNIRKILLIITFTVMLFVCSQNLSTVYAGIKTVFGYFSTVIIGLSLAFVINIMLNALENHVFAFMKKSKKKFIRSCCRPLCIVLCLIIIAGIIAILILGILPKFAQLLSTLSDSLPKLARDAMRWVENQLAAFHIAVDTFPSYTIDWDKFFTLITDYLTNSSTSLVGGAVNATTTIVSTVVNVVLSVVIAVYFILSKERISRYCARAMRAILPEKVANTVFRISSITYSAFANFITGQLTEACVIGSLCFIGMLILRLPNPGMISIIVGITAIVPIVGALVGEIVGTLLILIEAPFQALIFIIFILVLQQFESSLIYPRVVGKSVGLPGIMVFCSVLIGGNIAGVAGAFIAVPFASVIYQLFTEYINSNPVHAHNSRRKTKAEPISEESETKSV